MNLKILFAALLAAPVCAWAQEPGATHRTFDLASPSIKQILRDTAATQARAVEPITDDVASDHPIIFERAPPPPPPARQAPRPVAKPTSYGILDVILDAFIDGLLDYPAETDAERYDEQSSARSGDNLLSTYLRDEIQQRALKP